MSEHGRDDFSRHGILQHKGCRRMSEIMETDGWKTSFFQSRMKLMVQDTTGKGLSRIPAANKVQ